jgi:uncharacterized protein YbjT (DUF2867 family)
MYVVAGVTGQTGSVVANALLDQGEKVTVVVRSEAKGESWRARGAQVAVAELDDTKALTEILTTAAKGAYLLVPPNDATNDFLADRSRVSDAIAIAVQDSGIPHAVVLSSIGAQLPSGTGPILSAHYTEKVLRASGAKSVILLRAAYFIENFASVIPVVKEHGLLPTFLTADQKIPMVSTRDIGLTAAELLRQGPVTGVQTVELNGPVDLSPRDVAAQLSAILGKTVTVQQGPIEAAAGALQAAGLTPDLAGLYREMMAAANSGILRYESAAPLRGSTPVEETLRQLLG